MQSIIIITKTTTDNDKYIFIKKLKAFLKNQFSQQESCNNLYNNIVSV